MHVDLPTLGWQQPLAALCELVTCKGPRLAFTSNDRLLFAFGHRTIVNRTENMTTRCLSRLLHTSAYRCEASSRPSSSSSGGAGFRYVLDSHGRYVRQARDLSPRQRARAAYEQQEAERTIESQGLPSTVKEALEQRPETETAGPAPPAIASTSTSKSSSAGANAGTSKGAGKAALSEKEQAQLRQQYQKRKYVRGQDDSTLRVSMGIELEQPKQARLQRS